jgi:two-component system chemotaxis response regulator CheB
MIVKSVDAAAQTGERSETAYRVMVVDDSAVIRGFLTRWIESDPELQVVGSAGDGASAVRIAERLVPDVIVLDIEMPVMDGITTLPHLLRAVPDVKVVMVSTLTLRNADISLKALAAGASDYLTKPSSLRELQGSDDFQHDLVAKLKALGAARRRRTARIQAPAATAALPLAPSQVAAPPVIATPSRRAPLALRPPSKLKPKILAIGSSTGGPPALFALFGFLKNRIRLPIFITQHMPPTFTTIFAEHLGNIAGAPCAEAVDGSIIEAGHIYVAPGDWHMTVVDTPAGPRIHTNQDPPVNFCRPAVDPMMRSLTGIYGGHILACILTGMGQDGLNGGRSVVDAGGSLVAQDEATSVVWGMPGAVANAGLCCGVWPLDQVGRELERLAMGPP